MKTKSLTPLTTTFLKSLITLFALALFFTPALVVNAFPQFFVKSLNFVFDALLQGHIGDILLSVTSVAAFTFYWLKLKHQLTYGVVEILVAQLTIATAIFSIGSQVNKTVTLLQLFSGVYIIIRGLSNVREGLEKSLKTVHSGAMHNIMYDAWNDNFAEDIIGARTIFIILTIIILVYMVNTNFFAAICLTLKQLLEAFVTDVIKDLRASKVKESH